MSEEDLHRSFLAGEAHVGMRLDRFLAAAMPSRSRTFVRQLIDAGRVTVTGGSAAPASRLKAGCTILVTIPPPQPTNLSRWEATVPMLFVDDHLLVVAKPAPWVTHPGSGHPDKTLLNALLHAFPEIERVGSAARPGIVHRLDRGTSGVMVVARTALAYSSLVEQFSKRKVKKSYLALATGTPPSDQGTIDRPIGRDRFHRQRFSVRSPSGKPAVTTYRITETAGPFSRIKATPSTGRTHQIRVHLASIGLPLVGDRLYGRGSRFLPVGADALIATRDGAFLHAHSLTLRHPATGREMRFTSKEPDDFHKLWSLIQGKTKPHADK